MEQGELHSLRPDMHCSCLLTNAAAEDAPMLIFEKIQKHFGIWNKPVRRSEPVIESPHMMSTLFNYLQESKCSTARKNHWPDLLQPNVQFALRIVD